MEQFVMVESKKFDQLINKVDTFEKKLDNLTSKDPIWENTEGVCFMLNVSKRSIANYVQQGILKASKINGLNYFKRQDILNLLEENYK